MVNLVVFQGNLVRDPEFADTRGDTEILNITIAHSRKYKKKEDVTFMDCTAYGAVAENIGKFFSKGDPILVNGRLSQNNWKAQDGSKRTKIYITIEGFHFVGNTGKDRQSSGRGLTDQGRNRSQGGRDQSSGRGQSRGRDQDRDSQRDDDRGQPRDGGQRDRRDSDSRYQDDIPF